MRVWPSVSKMALGLCLAALLSACADPAQVARIRPGISSDVDLDAIRPPSGVTYNFTVEQGGFPIPAALTLTSRKRSSEVYDYTGAMVLQVPGNPAQLAEVAKVVSKAFKTKGPRIRGNKIFVPLKVRTDNRFRSITSSLLAANDIYVPHDCFAQLGTCTYTATRGGKAKLGFIAETTETGGIWRTVTRADPKSTPPGLRGARRMLTYSIDKNAVVIDMAINDLGAGTRDITVFKRQ